MSAVHKSRIIRIGNSQGIRVPKVLLESANLSGEVEIEAHADSLVIRPLSAKVRVGWDEQFQQMAAHGDDVLVDDTPVTSTWDAEEWQW